MIFIVTQEDGKEAEVSIETLFKLIIETSSNQKEPLLKDVDTITESMFLNLPKNYFSKTNFNQLFSIFFLSGYYYNNFTTKNKVRIKKENNV